MEEFDLPSYEYLTEEEKKNIYVHWFVGEEREQFFRAWLKY
jgi:hypothetical protein